MRRTFVWLGVVAILSWASAASAADTPSTAASPGSTTMASTASESIPAGVTSSETIDPAEAWRPLYPYVGTWKALPSGSEKPVKRTRVYASTSANRHLEISEIGPDRSRAEVRGVVSFDPARHALVMRQFDFDGSSSDLVLDPSASTNGRVVFASLGTETNRTRITYERTTAKIFVERIERAAAGGPFALVSETKFGRKD